MGGRSSSGNRSQSSGVSTQLSRALNKLMAETGTNHNGGDCAIIAKSMAEYLESIGVKKSEYSFAGELFTDNGQTGLTHVFVKYNGKYYDAVEGVIDTKGRNIVDNLTDDGTSIGNDKYGWIDYYGKKYVENFGSLSIMKQVRRKK